MEWIIGILAFLLLRQGSSVSRLDYALTALRVHRINLQGMELVAVIRIANPSSVAQSVDKILLNLYMKGSLIGTIQRNESFNLAPVDVTIIEIPINIGLGALARVLGSNLMSIIRRGIKETVNALRSQVVEVKGGLVSRGANFPINVAVQLSEYIPQQRNARIGEVNFNQIVAVLPKPKGIAETIHHDGDTADIMVEIANTFKLSWHQTQAVAGQFRGQNRTETCKNIYDFLRKNIRYQLDPIGVQFSKTPDRVIYDGFSDCKGYSILTASILRNSGIPFAFRFVSFKANQTPTHVYVVAKNEQGREILIDACLPFFNSEKPHTYKVDVVPN